MAQWARKFKKVQAKKLVKSNKSILRKKFFFTKINFLQFQKWPKINFLTRKSLKLQKKFFFIYLFDFTSFFALIFFKFSGPLCVSSYGLTYLQAAISSLTKSKSDCVKLIIHLSITLSDNVVLSDHKNVVFSRSLKYSMFCKRNLQALYQGRNTSLSMSLTPSSLNLKVSAFTTGLQGESKIFKNRGITRSSTSTYQLFLNFDFMKFLLLHKNITAELCNFTKFLLNK